MGSKMKIAIISGLLAMLLLISSEVAAARDLREGEYAKETNQVGDAKNVGVGGYFGTGPGSPGQYFGGGPGIPGPYFGGRPGIPGPYFGDRPGGFFGGRPDFFYPGGPGGFGGGPGGFFYPGAGNGFGPGFGFGGPAVIPRWGQGFGVGPGVIPGRG